MLDWTLDLVFSKDLVQFMTDRSEAPHDGEAAEPPDRISEEPADRVSEERR